MKFFLILIVFSSYADVWDPGEIEEGFVEDDVAMVSLGSHCLTASIIRSADLERPPILSIGFFP